MYKLCTMCPSLEKKDNKDFCFWYQSYVVDIKDTCGNHFLEKPRWTQEELEEISFGDIKKLSGDKLKKRIESDARMKKWEEDNKELIEEDNRRAAEQKERMMKKFKELQKLQEQK